MMLVHVLTHSIVLLLQLLETIFLIAFIFGAENKGSNIAVIFLLMMLAYSGMFFGMLLSVECNDLREANFVLTGIATPMVVLAGEFCLLFYACLQIFIIFFCLYFRNVLAASRNAYIVAIFIVLYAVHSAINRCSEHHVQGLLIFSSVRSTWCCHRNCMGILCHIAGTERPS